MSCEFLSRLTHQFKWCAAAMLCVLVSIFTSNTEAQASDPVVAEVGKVKITLSDFKTKYQEVLNQTQNPPTPELFLEDLVRYEVGVQEAYKKKLQNDPIVQERFKQELYKAVVEKDIGNEIQKIVVTEPMMRSFYKSNPEIRSSHILISYKPGASAGQIAEARKRAQEIYNEVKNSRRPFEELVRLYSDDDISKQTGGDIGYQTRVTLVPQYYDAALDLREGRIGGLVQTRFGFHIIKRTGTRSYPDANKRQLRAAVFDEERRKIFNRYFINLKRQYPIKQNTKLLRNFK